LVGLASSALILDVAHVERRRQNAGMDIEGLNRAAWDKAVEGGDNPYTRVVSSQQVADARAGSWAIHLSEHRTVPREWFPSDFASCAWPVVADNRRRSSPRPARR
jgi:hypothetical protein